MLPDLGTFVTALFTQQYTHQRQSRVCSIFTLLLSCTSKSQVYSTLLGSVDIDRDTHDMTL